MFAKYFDSLLVRQVRHFTKRSSNVKKTLLIRELNAGRTKLISSKRPEFDLFRDAFVAPDAKLGSIPLASGGWQHYKSKHDYFVIHPHLDEAETIQNAQYAKPFDTFGIDEQLVNNLRINCNIETTTYIQHEAIPKILSGSHTLIAAETGCGKTLAYLLPIVQQLLERKRNGFGRQSDSFNTPEVLIITPGRELAEQIGKVAEQLCQGTDLIVETIVGGSTKGKMMNPTMKPVDILVGSMGVVSKLMTTKIYRIHGVRHVVLDEADTMLDASFLSQLSHMLKKFPFYKNVHENGPNEMSTQLVMAAATMPHNMDELLGSVIDTSTVHEIVSPNLHKILPHVQQKFIRMRKQEKPVALMKLVKTELDKRRPVIVFTNKTVTSDFVEILLKDNSIPAVALHGDLLKVIRDGQFEKFQSGDINVLVTTDVTSRGLDTKRACHVVNYDFPKYVADYIHRCGRIGRVGSAEKCYVTNFVTGINEVELVRRIEHTTRTRGILPDVNADVTGILIKNRDKAEGVAEEGEQVFDEEHDERTFEEESEKGMPKK